MLRALLIAAAVTALVLWVMSRMGRFFFAERGAVIRPGDVRAARWMSSPRRVLALTLRDGTTAFIEEPDKALAMAVALRDRGIPVEESQA